ncbi:mitochondrial carrier domain-containing protein [Phellopilus nigrolimitatus]|nr:mitochondrial carrier domain-containing protein [Phellopilus nigrolimitatus]
MSSHIPADSERAPLLSESTKASPPSYQGSGLASGAPVILDEESAVASVEPAGPDDIDALPKPVSPRSTLKVVWTVALVLLALCVVAVFVKGFIDAEDVEFDLGKALKSALGGGLSGAAAMLLQVLTLMPLRTVMNYQYRYGRTTTEAVRTLYAAGGWRRFYAGLTAALFQGPIARFGDTAANAGILALLASNGFLKALPALVQTLFASAAAAAFRMVLTPVDTVKTTMQTQGKEGIALLRARVRACAPRSRSDLSHLLLVKIKVDGVGSLWYGAFATAAATFVGHYPWFGTYNYLSGALPLPHTLPQKLLRQAFIGFVRVRDLRHRVELAARREDVPPGERAPRLVRRGGARGDRDGRRQGPVRARPEDAHPGERAAGPDVLRAVEAVYGSMGREGVIYLDRRVRRKF